MNSTIFIVDDMPDILALADAFLKKHCYENVFCFESPVKALDSVRNGIVPSFVISDYNMPEMNGIDFLDEITTINPKIRGLIMTADASQVFSDKYSVIQKDKLLRLNSILKEEISAAVSDC